MTQNLESALFISIDFTLLTQVISTRFTNISQFIYHFKVIYMYRIILLDAKCDRTDRAHTYNMYNVKSSFKVL